MRPRCSNPAAVTWRKGKSPDWGFELTGFRAFGSGVWVCSLGFGLLLREILACGALARKPFLKQQYSNSAGTLSRRHPFAGGFRSVWLNFRNPKPNLKPRPFTHTGSSHPGLSFSDTSEEPSLQNQQCLLGSVQGSE